MPTRAASNLHLALLRKPHGGNHISIVIGLHPRFGRLESRPDESVSTRLLSVMSQVAFGAKRTSTGKQTRLDRSKMTFADMDGARLLQCTRLIQRGTKCCGSSAAMPASRALAA